MLKASSASGSSSTSEPIPHSRPTIGERERAAVADVLAGGWIAQGPQVEALESEGAAALGQSGAVAVGSGSQALLVALLGMGMGAGSRVGIPAFTCSAVLHAVEWAGAEPVLLDNAEGALGPDAGSVEGAGHLDAVIVVHPWGFPHDTAAWSEAVPVVIEDCAQSIGARWQGSVVGAAGDVSITSFYATKMLCAGEGGLVAASDPGLLETIRDLREYDGKSAHAIRFNFKMSDVQAALARVQLGRLPEFLERRRRLAARYGEAVRSLGLQPVPIPEGAEPSWYRYLCWSPVEVGALLDHCQAFGVHCRRPVPVTLDRLLGHKPLPGARYAWEHLISLPIYPELGEGEQERVVEVLGTGLKEGGVG